MNKYIVYLSPLPDGDEIVEADSIEVMETGQICFYVNNPNGDPVPELIAVFPAGCAVVKLEEGEKKQPVQLLNKDEKEFYSVTTGGDNANDVYPKKNKKKKLEEPDGVENRFEEDQYEWEELG